MRKENIILGGVFIFLLVLAFAFEPLMAWKDNLSRPNNFLKNVKVEEIVKINLDKNGEKITLERQGDKWKIADTKDFYVQDKDKLFETYLEDAINGNLDLVSNNKDKKSEYETDDSGVKITLEGNDGVLADFIIGKMTGDFAGAYVSLPDSDETYKIDGNLAYGFNKDINLWYDTAIFTDDAKKITKVRFQYPNSEFTVEKKDGKWKGTLPYSFSVDKEKISKVIDLMSGLNAVDVPEQTFEGTGLEKHLIIVEVSGDGVKNTLMVGDANEDGNYYAKKGSSDNIYLITPEQKEILETSIRGLR